MKNLIFTTFCLLVISNSYGAVNQAIVNGNWNATSTWSLVHVPIAGENVVIASGKTVTINNLENYAGNLTVDIYGLMKLNGGSLYLVASSVISIYTGGELIGMGNNTELIKIGGVVKYDGSNQTPVFGPQMAYSASGSGFKPFIPLPVKFASFSIEGQQTGVLILWTTAMEENVSYFDVERSEDGSKFIAIGRVSATGTTSNLSKYSFDDRNTLSGNIYYRIREVEKDGSFQYTDIRVIKLNNAIANTVQITAISHSLIMQFPNAISGNVLVRIVSFDGKVLSQQLLNNPFGQVVLSENNSLRGNYIVSLSNQNNFNTSKQVQF